MQDAKRMSEGRIVNALTIDVEDYFQVSALAPNIPRSQWNVIPCRVENNIDRILATRTAKHTVIPNTAEERARWCIIVLPTYSCIITIISISP